MAATSDDDVQDGDTTAAGVAPATSSADEEEDRTVQQPPDPKIRSAIAKELKQPSPAPPSSATGRSTPRAPIAIPSAAAKPGATGANSPVVTAKRMTVVGLAPPAAGSAAAPPTARVPTNISPLATMMDKKVGPTSTNPTSTSTAAAASAARPPAAAKPASAAASPGSAAAKPPNANEADEEDASITATAPAPRVGSGAAASAGVVVKPPPIPLTLPGPVQIREMPPPEEEPLDETEVRTVVSAPAPEAPASPSASRPAAGSAPAAAAAAKEEPEEELEDSVTTQAPSMVQGGRLPEEEEPKTSPPVMSPARAPAPIPAAGRSPFDQPPIPSAAAAAAATAPPEEPDSGEDAYNVEDSVTTRGPAVPEDFRLDDSVTADNHAAAVEHPPESSGRWPSPVTPIGARAATMSQALGLPPKNAGLPPAIEDGTEGTTNRFAGQNKKVPPRPATSTLASPAALNLPPKVGAAADEDEEDLQEDNRTAVMINAPVKPNGPSGSARAARSQMAGGMSTHVSAGVAARAQAPADKLSSESGLRVAPEHQHAPPPPTDERASLGAMMAGALNANHERGSGVAPREYPSQPLPALQPHQVPHHYPASEPNLALGATLPANSPHIQGQLQAQMSQMQQYDFASTIKKPRYGLLVGLVALLSFAIPLVLFLWLHQNVQEPYGRSPSEVASDKQGFAPPPGKSLAPAASSATKNPKRR